MRSFAEFSGDENPIHVDRTEARRFGFSGEVAHGAILIAEISRVIGMELPGKGALWVSSELDFVGPVPVGSEVWIEATVAHVSPAYGLAVLELSATRLQSESAVLRGRATVKLMEQQMPLNYTPLSEQTVLVTGGTRGLGRTVVSAALERGARVVAVYRSDRTAADELHASAGDAAGRLDCIQADIAASEAVSDLFDQLGSRRIDSVVHAASPALDDVALEDLDWSDLEPFLRTYLGGGLEIVKRCVPGFADAGGGRVIFIGSEATRQPRPEWTHYIAAKGALAGLMRGLAVELASTQTTVNMVSPGALHTSSQFHEGAKTIVRNQTPLKRLVTEEEVAEVVLFLLEQGGSFMTGTDIPLSGGRVFLS